MLVCDKCNKRKDITPIVIKIEPEKMPDTNYWADLCPECVKELTKEIKKKIGEK